MSQNLQGQMTARVPVEIRVTRISRGLLRRRSYVELEVVTPGGQTIQSLRVNDTFAVTIVLESPDSREKQNGG